MFSAIWQAGKSVFNRIKETIKKLTKPAVVTLTAGAVTDLTRSRQDLVAENAILRQQVIVLKRQIKRPKFTSGDHFRLTFLSRLTDFWQSALHIVQPETVLRWHRELFRRYWKRISTPQKPRTTYPSRNGRTNPADEWTAQPIQEATP